MKDENIVTLTIDTSDTECGSLVSSGHKAVDQTSLQDAIQESFKEAFVYHFDRRDNLTWVTIEPLVKQVQTVFNNCKKLEKTVTDAKEREALEFTLQSTNQVYHFLTSLLAEAEIKFKQEENSNVKH